MRIEDLKRYEVTFGAANRIDEIEGHTFVSLNTMAMDSDVASQEVKTEARRYDSNRSVCFGVGTSEPSCCCWLQLPGERQLCRPARAHDWQCHLAHAFATLPGGRPPVRGRATARGGPHHVRAPELQIRDAPPRALARAVGGAAGQGAAGPGALGPYARLVRVPAP
ncbi:hypothetical protein ON010_g16645 [Phytophthora cinnamomi]|nr:hypothetical protein ON010_g16645 [Phytophthora cinnamomi]